MISIFVCIIFLVIYRRSQGLLVIIRITENILNQKWFNGHLSGNKYEDSMCVRVLFTEVILFLSRERGERKKRERERMK